MSREVDTDFRRLQSFMSNYSLAEQSGNVSFSKSLKCLHRKLYSYIVFLNELEFQGYEDIVSLQYFKEVGSDLILSLFCWINGAYKPSKLQIRSSIENYIKAMMHSELNEIIEIKSVYEIFELAKDAKCFKFKYTREFFGEIHNEYSILCATVHGDYEKLSNIQGLIQFPKYDNENAQEVFLHYEKIVNAFLCIIYYTFYDTIFRMHELNRDQFLQGLEKKEKTAIYRIKTQEDS